MIHEKQVRQLCAIHTVNNILQLSKNHDCIVDSGGGDISNDINKQIYIINEWRCHGRLLYRQKRLRGSDSSTSDNELCNAASSKKMNWSDVATQSEFNEIAADFTQREIRLMEGNEPITQDSTEVSQQQQAGSKLSAMQRLRSNYGTPLFGNYSVEVIETALSRRGVKLEYYRVQEEKTSESNSGPLSKNQEEILIGFIVHEEETANSLSYLRRLGSHIPLIRNICRGGRHWWAITGVKRSCYTSTASSDNENDTIHEKKQMKEDKEWFLIDSNLDHIPTVSSDDDLIDYLRDVQGRGALIFRCYV